MAAGGAAAAALIKTIPSAPISTKVIGASAAALGVSGAVVVGSAVGEAINKI